MDPILIVDDEKDNLEALQRLLRGQYEVTVTTSPFEALRLAQAHTYHVIVSDQRMPEMTGVELLEKAKKLCPLTTRILLTGYTDTESVIEAINRGQVYRYISKPWEPDELRITLRQANEAFLLRKELEDKNVALKTALEELTVLDRAKGRFMSLVSHELNTPLTVLNSFIELLSQTKEDLPVDVGKAITSIQGASHRFSEIVKEVITYVRLESENKLQLQVSDLALIIQNIKAQLFKELSEKGIELNLDLKMAKPVLIDQEKMILALNYVLQDAIYRSPKNSKIEISLSENVDGLILTLQSEGEPLSPNAFTPLETHQPELHHHQNLGLGLAIARAILNRHRGQITPKGTALLLTVPFQTLN